MKDELGDRMKRDYESRLRFLLPRRTYTLLRIDGKAFHTYTRGCARPFDTALMDDMDTAAAALCQEAQGAAFAFVQSDEISVLLTDFASTTTEAWLDGNLQKLASISASIVTAHFNAARFARGITEKIAYFDARVWTIPMRVEVENYFIWRQTDATRNAVSMTAQAHFSHRSLQNTSTDAMQERLFTEKGINFNDLPVGFKRGRIVERETTEQNITYTDKRSGETKSTQALRRRWVVKEPPIFTKERAFLERLISAAG
jgi:tRNA(His) guanylyltransferase